MYAVQTNLNVQADESKNTSQDTGKKSQAVNNEKDLKVVAVGDSLTRGMGDETGKGYIGYLTDEMKAKSKKPVIVQNLGISGQKSDSLLAQVKTYSVTRQLKEADYILITIGGNDLFQGGQTLVDFQPAAVKSIQQKYLHNLEAILSHVRSSNSGAVIFLVGLYNPFIELENGKDTSQVVREWNYKSAEAAAKQIKTVYVPTFDLFELKVNDYLYTDRFHPNSKGYRLIAERVAALLTW
ncbi:lysophospholipase L1-like esterase [Peribacillus deserti]|uniref:Lysophospholipase L1-like esterase n=1 Tax=Peribacillus deserti TaxID=673318 RepID=A0ABS2QJS8_9BACI|nr:SGNH/GDSL hydrolase family protein [Peribacillus deserti]MBM7693423.1 lysophospholipase L1-like esterase [Peribacillus deserti]